jgi:hypothetical protein
MLHETKLFRAFQILEIVRVYRENQRFYYTALVRIIRPVARIFQTFESVSAARRTGHFETLMKSN